MEFFATCPAGFEQLLADELSDMGCASIRPLRGQVSFTGQLRDAYRVCLWSRLASNVTAVIARIDATDSDTLYASALEVAWEEHLAVGDTFSVNAHGTSETLVNSKFVALRTSDAIRDRMLSKSGTRPVSAPRDADLTFVVRLRDDRATIGVNLAGETLFSRGYELSSGREGKSVHALRPDYAAAALLAAGWPAASREADSVCTLLYAGGGTLVAEAAGIAQDQAPGLLRQRWGHEKWLKSSARSWANLIKEARARAEAGLEREPRIIVVDERRRTERDCRRVLGAAGLSANISFVDDASGLADELGGATLACAVADTSWPHADELSLSVCCNDALTHVIDTLPARTRVATFSSDTSVSTAVGTEPDYTLDVRLGRDSAYLSSYVTAPETPERCHVTLEDGTRINVAMAASDQFAARLQKVAAERAAWAEAEWVSCYRVYDADLPDYNVAIDLYTQAEETCRGRAPRRWLVVQEYAAPREISRDKTSKRLHDIAAIAPRVMNVTPECVYFKTRTRAKGGSQYADKNIHGKTHVIEEGGLLFEVDFMSHLDTGIFLDHRPTREIIREIAKGFASPDKRFLNLFAYTGTATCYAADGGMTNTTTVDMSKTYLARARSNMRRNRFRGEGHAFEQADVLKWVDEQRHAGERYDLIFCDPPTFSNSSGMRRRGWDVQRDHGELLIALTRMLTADGIAIFSCNLRTFEPDMKKLTRAHVELVEITHDTSAVSMLGIDPSRVPASTIPADFERNGKIHKVYLVRRAQEG